MKICITNARGRLARLIRDAAAGDDVVLTHNGVAVARLVAIKSKSSGSEHALLNATETAETGSDGK